MGHNALSKSCPARIPVPVEDAVQVDGGPVPDEGDGGGDGGGDVEGEGVGDGLDDSVFDVEDLLGNSSEDDLF